MTELTIGEHRGRRAGDLIELAVRGALTLTDLTALRSLAQEVLAQEQGRCFMLVDVTALTGIDPDARRLMAAWSKVELERLSGTALYGCGFAMRTLITLSLNAIQFFAKRPLDTVILRDEAEARGWIAARRAALEETVQHGG